MARDSMAGGEVLKGEGGVKEPQKEKSKTRSGLAEVPAKEEFLAGVEKMGGGKAREDPQTLRQEP